VRRPTRVDDSRRVAERQRPSRMLSFVFFPWTRPYSPFRPAPAGARPRSDSPFSSPRSVGVALSADLSTLAAFLPFTLTLHKLLGGFATSFLEVKEEQLVTAVSPTFCARSRGILPSFLAFFFPFVPYEALPSRKLGRFHRRGKANSGEKPSRSE